MVMLNRRCVQVHTGGFAESASDDMLVPFAMVTRFVADQTCRLEQAASYQDLQEQLDRLRPQTISLLVSVSMVSLPTSHYEQLAKLIKAKI